MIFKCSKVVRNGSKSLKIHKYLFNRLLLVIFFLSLSHSVYAENKIPIKEKNYLPFMSINDGVMHACGHDSHMAILMGAAEILSNNRDFEGTVKFIFQGAEEGPPPGEEGGARMMIKEGVVKNPNVDAIFGLHIAAQLPMNKVLVSKIVGLTIHQLI